MWVNVIFVAYSKILFFCPGQKVLDKSNFCCIFKRYMKEYHCGFELLAFYPIQITLSMKKKLFSTHSDEIECPHNRALNICANKPERWVGKSLCHGDIGSPLYPVNCATQGPVCLYGILQQPSEFGCPAKDAIFTRVSVFAHWINLTIENMMNIVPSFFSGEMCNIT